MIWDVTSPCTWYRKTGWLTVSHSAANEKSKKKNKKIKKIKNKTLTRKAKAKDKKQAALSETIPFKRFTVA